MRVHRGYVVPPRELEHMRRGGSGDAHRVPKRVADAHLGGHGHATARQRRCVNAVEAMASAYVSRWRCGVRVALALWRDEGCDESRCVRAVSRRAVARPAVPKVGLPAGWYRERGASIVLPVNEEAKPARADPRCMDYASVLKSCCRRKEALLCPRVHKRKHLEVRVVLVPLAEATVLDHDERVPPCLVAVPQVEALLVPHLLNRALYSPC